MLRPTFSSLLPSVATTSSTVHLHVLPYLLHPPSLSPWPQEQEADGGSGPLRWDLMIADERGNRWWGGCQRLGSAMTTCEGLLQFYAWCPTQTSFSEKTLQHEHWMQPRSPSSNLHTDANWCGHWLNLLMHVHVAVILLRHAWAWELHAFPCKYSSALPTLKSLQMIVKTSLGMRIAWMHTIYGICVHTAVSFSCLFI